LSQVACAGHPVDLAFDLSKVCDAEAAKLYALAFNEDKEFYAFYRSMSAYRKTFAEKGDILLLDPNSDFFKYLSNSKVD